MSSIVPPMSATNVTNNYITNNLDVLKTATKPINLVIDGKVIGRVLAPIMNQELNYDLNKDLLGKGAVQW